MTRESRPEDEEQPPQGGAIPTVAGSVDETTPLLSGSFVPATRRPPKGAQRQQEQEAEEEDDDEASQGEGETLVATEDMSPTRRNFILGTSYVGVFLGAIDATIFATLSGPIASEFHSLSLFSWLASAFLIAQAAFQPITGRLTDIFGRGPGLVFSNLLFAAGNLICGLARSEGAMILGRVVSGVGAGGLMSISTFLASDLVPLRKRGVVQGLGNIAYGSGSMLGGVFGGLVNDRTRLGWRLAFLLQVPVVLASAVLAFALIRIPPKVSNKSLVSRIDFAGVLLTISFLVLLLLGLNAGGNLVPWTHPLVLTTIPLSFVALAGFVYWEANRARQPVIPVRLLVNRTVLAACLTSLVCSMSLMMVMYYIPMYLQVLGNSTADAGLRLIGTSLGVAVSSVASGYVMKRTGRYVRLGVAALAVYSVGFAVVSTLGRSSSNWTPLVGLLFVGLGFGAMLTVTLLACIAAVDHEHQAVITSATYGFRSIGSTLGITVASAIYQNVLRGNLGARFGGEPGAAEEIDRIRDDLDEIKHLPDGWRDGVIDSFMEAFGAVWFAALGLAVLGLVFVSFMRQYTLHTNLARK